MEFDTLHRIFFSPSQNMSALSDSSIDLVVTSPPYPMIEMWDGIMATQNEEIAKAFAANDGKKAFELTHRELDKVWNECFRVLKEGGFLCINIGDATRTIEGEFELFNNHSRITSYCTNIGFTNLPNIIWRKPTNSPNKFMGSGMLPCGAYVTLEHEWILIFRKGSKRPYKSDSEKEQRRRSSFFWEERNHWFSDLWEIKGTKQTITNTKSRERNASYPFTVPYRLINMYSQQGDTVLDPFFGLGTTSMAAMVTGRNSVGFEIDSKLLYSVKENISTIDLMSANKTISDRFNKHLCFVEEREKAGKEVKYFNDSMQCKVMTKQELDMQLHYLTSIKNISDEPLTYQCKYSDSTDMRDAPFTLGL